ncbi:hypothetical protein [Amycolatopsis tucumanensis]
MLCPRRNAATGNSIGMVAGPPAVCGSKYLRPLVNTWSTIIGFTIRGR